MSSRSENEKQKQIQEKCQVILGNLLREEDNKYCVDCDAKGPRWASWNLGIFLCIRCAGIHRNLGVHISKVKSVNLDTWTPEQVACLQQMGNSQARAVYEANLPDSFRRPQTDSSLEAFIRSKYEQKKYIAKEWVPPPPPKPAFDIEEEKKREKERKRTRVKVANPVALEISSLPQQQPTVALPRPHSTTAQPVTLSKSQEKNENSQKQDSCTADLLSLGDVTNNQQSDDIFDAFLSASRPENNTSSSPVTTTTETISVSNKSYDTTDLFTEMVIPNSAQNKMTKESILSLYGSSQNQQAVPPQVPPVYGLPTGGIFLSQPGFAPVMPRFATVTNPTVVPNGFPGITQVGSVQQVQQQMGNLQIQGNVWNTSGVPVTSMPTAQMQMYSKDTATANIGYPAGNNVPSNFWH